MPSVARAYQVSLILKCRPDQSLIRLEFSSDKLSEYLLCTCSTHRCPLATNYPTSLQWSPVIPISAPQHPLRPPLNAPIPPPPPLFFAHIANEIQLKRPHFNKAHFKKESTKIAHVVPRELRPQGQSLRLREVPGIVDQLVSDLWDLVFEYVRMGSDGVDDEMLSVDVSFLTVAVACSKLSDQTGPPHLVQVHWRFSSRPGLPAQQLAASPDGRVAD